MATREVYDRDGNLVAVEQIPDPPARRLAPIEIVELFTAAELLSIEQSTNLSAVAFRNYLFAAVNTVALDDPRLIGGIQLFQSLGFLTSQRAPAILQGVKP